MVTPGVPPIPHVGGPITGPGTATVLVGKMPSAAMGDMCTCVGPPNAKIVGATTVLIGKKPAGIVRPGSLAHPGSSVIPTCMNVLIGDSAGGGGGGGGGLMAAAIQAIFEMLKAAAQKARDAAAAIAQLLQSGEAPVPASVGNLKAELTQEVARTLPPGQAGKIVDVMGMQQAASTGTPMVEPCLPENL